MIIDLHGIQSIDALHDSFKRALKFPSFYGDNWDALWDTLTGMKEMPEKITLLGYAQFASRFPSEDKAFSKIISDYNDHYFRLGKRQRIEVA
jgi:ribonuclease inhibitor